MVSELLNKVSSREARVGIVGLGYVGLPLAIEFTNAGFHVLGLDIDPGKTEMLSRSESYIKHIPSEVLVKLNSTGRFTATTDFSRSAECDAVIICVPTPLTRHREPDMSYIESTAGKLSPYLRKGQLFSLESTTFPGTTAEVLMPILEKSTGLKAGKDYYLAYSPEREDPNNKDFSTSTIPKVVGADDPDSLALAKAYYDTVICRTVPVSSAATAEATKLLENIFRSVNIAMVNELKMIFTKMGIDIWEVIEAAKTKPFGYMPFYPGPGLGGHCIPIDPFYLTWKAREFEATTRFIELAGEINTQMPHYVIERTMEAFNCMKIVMNGSRILIVGLAYKKNVDDLRESPSFKLWELFEERGAQVSYYDPYCPKVPKIREHMKFFGKTSIDIANSDMFDAVVISTAHDSVDHEALARLGRCVIDTRNALPGVEAVIRA
ncbi:MAG: nucleotide sugar dehydrogenase [Victivallales bacterium]|nr:nucleotide sugar dehydrogenase [Victivallales bacterium]